MRVAVLVAVWVAVLVAVAVGVLVAVLVAVCVSVGVAVLVEVLVAVFVRVEVNVLVTVGEPNVKSIDCGLTPFIAFSPVKPVIEAASMVDVPGDARATGTMKLQTLKDMYPPLTTIVVAPSAVGGEASSA